MTTEKEVKSSKKKKVHVPIINRAETHFGSSYTKEADIQKKKKKKKELLHFPPLTLLPGLLF